MSLSSRWHEISMTHSELSLSSIASIFSQISLFFVYSHSKKKSFKSSLYFTVLGIRIHDIPCAWSTPIRNYILNILSFPNIILSDLMYEILTETCVLCSNMILDQPWLLTLGCVVHRVLCCLGLEAFFLTTSSLAGWLATKLCLRSIGFGLIMLIIIHNHVTANACAYGATTRYTNTKYFVLLLSIIKHIVNRKKKTKTISMWFVSSKIVSTTYTLHVPSHTKFSQKKKKKTLS